MANNNNANKEYRISFVGNVMKDVHVEYEMKIVDNKDNAWTLRKRYRELRDFHEQLKLIYSNILTSFPPKRLFGNTDAKFIESRQRELEKYMQNVMNIQNVTSHDFVKNFLQIPNQPEEVYHVCETATDRLVRYVKSRLLDLSQPTEQFFDTLEIKQKERVYFNLLRDTCVLDEKLHPSLLAVVAPSALPKFCVFNNEQWENVVMRPSLASSGQWKIAKEKLNELVALNDINNDMEGIDLLRAKFPGADESDADSFMNALNSQ